MEKEKNIKKSAGAAENIKKKNAHPTSAVPEGIRGLERNHPQTPTSELAASVDANTPNLLPDSSTLNASENTTPSYENNENKSNELQQPQQVMEPPQGEPMAPPQGMPQGVQMPPMQGAPMPRGPHYNSHAQRTWRERMMGRLGLGDARETRNIFPRWLSQYAIWTYILALAAVSILYSAHALPWYYMLSGIVSVLVFFLYGRKVVQDTSVKKIKKAIGFEKRIFVIAFIPRVLFMSLLYWIFMENYGDAFGFENGDATYYHDLGQFVAGLIEKGNYHFYDEISHWSGNEDIADMGYGTYVGFIYLLTGNSIIAVRLLKCVWSALTVLLIYRLANRNFGDRVARMAAIFCALWPNFWYYCGVHLKETEMVFLVVLFTEQADQMLQSRQFTAWKVIPTLLVGAVLFTFRTPLALVALLALLFTIVMLSSRVVSWGKRVIVGIIAVLLIGITMGNRIEEQSRKLIESAQTQGQAQNMEWRSRRENGNSFAKYAGAAVFAPMILTIPFPTMAEPYEGQELQQLLNGGNFIKNILSGFTILALIVLLLSGKWREHALPLSFMLGYVMVLVMSTFAQSERFHQPVMAFELMFAAYGISVVAGQKKYRRWVLYWCGLMFVAAIAWNWFKLAGRGLV